MLFAMEMDDGQIIVVDILIEDILKRHAAIYSDKPTRLTWRVEKTDLPDWDKREAWVREGERIIIDPTRIKVPEPTIEDRLSKVEESVKLPQATKTRGEK